LARIAPQRRTALRHRRFFVMCAFSHSLAAQGNPRDWRTFRCTLNRKTSHRLNCR
jgi:hypothetical protein